MPFARFAATLLLVWAVPALGFPVVPLQLTIQPRPSAPSNPHSSVPAIDANQARRIEAAAAVARMVDQAAEFIDGGKLRDASALLVNLRNQLGEPRDVRVETLLARIALAENRPDEALKLVAPWVNQRDNYDPALSDCYLAGAGAQLALGQNFQALTIFDWVASKAQGEPLILAAEGCGKALLRMKDFKRAAECFEFAIKVAKTPGYKEYGKYLARLKEQLEWARRLADIGLYGEDFVLYRDAEKARRNDKKYKEARSVYVEIVKRFPDGPYAEASQLYGAKCLIEMGKPAEAERELMTLRKANPYGLYGGEVMLELGRIALECHLQPQAARGCFLLLDTWTREFKNKLPLEIEKLAAVPEAAVKVTTPPKEEKYVDFWGNVKKSEIKPGMLVNPKTCPWYLDDLREQCAMYMGFLCFVEGDKENALAWYKKILDCDPATRRLDTSGEWNDYSRLKWGAEHGYLYAFPEELAVFKDQRQKLAVFVADFYYVTQRWEMAGAMAQRMLKGEFGALTPAAREYAQFAYAAATYWAKGREAAVPEYVKVIQGRMEGGWKTITEFRAAYCAANLALEVNNAKTQTQARSLLAALVRSPQQNEFTYKAGIVLAQDLVKQGRIPEGMQLLKDFPEKSGPYKDLANYNLEQYAKHYSGKRN